MILNNKHKNNSYKYYFHCSFFVFSSIISYQTTYRNIISAIFSSLYLKKEKDRNNAVFSHFLSAFVLKSYSIKYRISLYFFFKSFVIYKGKNYCFKAVRERRLCDKLKKRNKILFIELIKIIED